MSQTSTTITVPATTANLGPGFDCVGVALSLYNQFRFSLLEDRPAGSCEITVRGQEEAKVSTRSNNLVYRSFCRLYEYLTQEPPAVKIEIALGVPLTRGLGSSATAIMGGLVGANELTGNALTLAEVRDLAIAIEGHPDNVVPALLGNCQLCVADQQRWEICQLPWHPEVVPVVAIPDFELSTEEARKVLPSQLSRADAVFNTAHFGLLVRGLETGRGEWLRAALADRLHQPYRQKLIRGYEEVQTAACQAGAYGLVISGAGPTLLALTNNQRAEAVTEAILLAWKNNSVKAEVRSLAIDTKGANVID